MPEKGNILFISSANPIVGTGSIAMDYVKALQQGGYHVDFLTKYKVDSYPEILYVTRRYKNKYIDKLSNLKFKLWVKFCNPNIEQHSLFYTKESTPPVKIEKILKSIRKCYDIVIVFFWQELLSYATVKAIYNKLGKKSKIVFLCADYSTMTGGCHFMGSCNNYKSGCGNCEMLRFNNSNDFTAWNMKYRIATNAEIKPFVFVNQYMLSFFKESPAMQSGAILANMSMILNLDEFKPHNQVSVKKKYSVPSEKKFIILFGCQSISDERKGIKYLIESIILFYEKLSMKERRAILLVIAGKNVEKISQQLPFDIMSVGYVPFKELPEIYSIADVFLSPSVNDAGPSMVNQSIACGTPVISFDIGTAQEVIKNRGTGYCVPLKDTEAFAESIFKIYQQNPEERIEMRKKCRKVAQQFHSYKAFLHNFENTLFNTIPIT